MIKVNRLSKSFSDFKAVDDVSFDVSPGEVLGFLGPNGAGKSTTMKMLTGFLEPSSGSVEIAGHNVWQDPISAQKEIGYLPEGAPGYADMTVKSSLEFIGQARGYNGRDLATRIEQAVAKVQLQSVLEKRIENLSKGFRRRLGLAQALLHDPKILILDEPTDGLDPNQKHQVRELIRSLSKDKIVVVSTHILEEVSAVCTRAMILAQGKIVFDGTPGELAEKSDFHNAVSLRMDRLSEELVQTLSALDGVASIEREGEDQLIILPKDGQSILASVNQVLHSTDGQVEELHVEVGRLDDVFRKLTHETEGVRA